MSGVWRALTEQLHVALGLQGGGTFRSYETWDSSSGEHHNVTDRTLGLLPYGVITYGTGDAHLSFTLQPVFVRENGVWEKAQLLPMLSGFVRLGAYWGLAGEAVVPLFSSSSSAFGNNALGLVGLRLFGQHLSLDVGAIARLEGDGIAAHPGGSLMFHWQ